MAVTKTVKQDKPTHTNIDDLLPGDLLSDDEQVVFAVKPSLWTIAFLQWLIRSYVLTDNRVIRIRGVLTIDIFQCSLVRIQNTFLVLTLPQRLLGLGSIVFATAGTGSVEAIWQHIKNPLSIHQQLIRAINAAGSKPITPTEGTGGDKSL